MMTQNFAKPTPSPLDKALDERAFGLSKQFRRLEAEILEVLEKMDAHKSYRALGFNSLYEYAVKRLGFSDAVAFQFINVSRKAKEVPQLKAAIVAGKLSVSTAKKITGVINSDNAQDWLVKAQTLPQKQLEKEVVRVAPKEATPERLTYVTPERLKIQCGVSEQLHRDLVRVQDILSQRLRRAASLEEALCFMTELFLEKNDPVRKARRHVARNNLLQEIPEQKTNLKLDGIKGEPLAQAEETKLGAMHEITPKQASEPSNPSESHGKSNLFPANPLEVLRPARLRFHRKPIPAKQKHLVFMRDQGQCVFEDASSQRCTQQRWLELHHLVPKKHGGADEAKNLVTLCHRHHRQLHF